MSDEARRGGARETAVSPEDRADLVMSRLRGGDLCPDCEGECNCYGAGYTQDSTWNPHPHSDHFEQWGVMACGRCGGLPFERRVELAALCGDPIALAVTGQTSPVKERLYDTAVMNNATGVVQLSIFEPPFRFIRDLKAFGTVVVARATAVVARFAFCAWAGEDLRHGGAPECDLHRASGRRCWRCGGCGVVSLAARLTAAVGDWSKDPTRENHEAWREAWTECLRTALRPLDLPMEEWLIRSNGLPGTAYDLAIQFHVEKLAIQAVRDDLAKWSLQ